MAGSLLGIEFVADGRSGEASSGGGLRRAVQTPPARRPGAAALTVVGLLASLFTVLAPLSACEAQPPSPPPLAKKFKPQVDVLEALLFPEGQDLVVRFDDVIVGQGRPLTATKWDPPGPKTQGSLEIRTLLGGDFVEAGTGLAKGRPANFVQLYAPSLQPFAGHPDQVLQVAFGGGAAEQLKVVERPGCIVVASHDHGRISRMASVTEADALNHTSGESRRSDEIRARVEDCRTRAAAAAVGAWGVFSAPGEAVIKVDGSPATGPAAGLFDEEVAQALPRIEPGLSRQRFRELTAGGN